MECPGYELFRLENGVSKGKTKQSNDIVVTRDAAERLIDKRSSTTPPAFALTESSEDQVMAFFVNRMVMEPHGAPSAHFAPLWAEPELPSYLKCSMNAVAYNFTSITPQFTHFRYDSVRQYTLATREIKSVIEQNRTYNNDHMLMALHCLWLWEVRESSQVSGVLSDNNSYPSS